MDASIILCDIDLYIFIYGYLRKPKSSILPQTRISDTFQLYRDVSHYAYLTTYVIEIVMDCFY